jgi:hypothetical protein
MPALLVEVVSGVQTAPAAALPASTLLVIAPPSPTLLTKLLLLLLLTGVFDRTTLNFTALPPARPPRLLRSKLIYTCSPASTSDADKCS